jgi:DNA-binding transcriptional LysR family regulator
MSSDRGSERGLTQLPDNYSFINSVDLYCRMELRDIEYFAAIAEHGHLGRAAESLGLGQPALSMSLRRLEAAARTKLVRRTPKGVELTAVGAALITHVRRLRLARDDLARELAALAQGLAGHLRMGAGPQVGEHLLPLALARLLREAPKVTVDVLLSDADVVVPALREGRLELAALVTPKSPYDGLEQEHLYDEDWVVYASTRHRLAKHKRLSVNHLVAERWAYSSADTHIAYQQWLQQAFADLGLPPPRVAVTSRSQALRFELVGASDLLGFAEEANVNKGAKRYGLKTLAVTGLTWRRSVGVMYRKDAYLSPAASRLVDILKLTARA